MFFDAIVFIGSPLPAGIAAKFQHSADIVALNLLAHQVLMRAFSRLIDIADLRKWAQKNRVTEIS